MGRNEAYDDVIRANIAVHSRMADSYNTCEPHFRPENVQRVDGILRGLVQKTHATRLLDLGCGTGFIINIAKAYLEEIHGVDVTEAMLQKVDTSGHARIKLFQEDTGTFAPDEGPYDIATAYSFLHHLYDVEPTFRTAFRGLKKGGILYADLEPNYYFWEELAKLDRDGIYDAVVKREIENVTYKDEDIEKSFGVTGDTFNRAEYGKNILGGFKEGEISDKLKRAGFSSVTVEYHWFCGQGTLINDQQYGEAERFRYADIVDRTLQRMMPLSRHLFKYLRIVAEK